MKRVLICGHRGFPEKYPQNTLPGFRRAIEIGCDRIEYDLHLTADGHLVVCHNPTVDNTSNGHGKISEMTFAELRKLDFGSWKGSQFAGTMIPEFQEVLELANTLNPHLFHLVELKVDSPDFAELVLRELAKWDMAGRFTLVSFHLDLLREMKRRHPDVLIHGNPNPTNGQFNYEDFRMFDSAGLHRSNITAEVIKGFHSVGTMVDAWPVDTAEEFRRQMDFGADSVTSNNPEALLAERDAILGSTKTEER